VTRRAAFFVAIAAVVFFIHQPYFGLPYFWDEMGQFVPAALDIYHDLAWVPHSTVPNAHPPGVMAYLAAVWKIAGYSIPATRAAMLALASLAVLLTMLLTGQLSPGARGWWVFAPAVLLLVDPLFYMQSMMAQLDMPATLFTVLALWLFFQDRHRLAALASVALVLTKETGALLPLILAVALWMDRDRRRYAAYYVAPFIALAVWFFVLWRATGQLFGDAGFTHYNLVYSLNPVRAAMSLLRRVYYLFVGDFRWIGTLAILAAWRHSAIYSTRAFKIAGTFFCAHVLMVSLLGGAELERYLLPVMPLLYIAMTAAFLTLRPLLRYAGVPLLAAGLVTGLFMNPPFPFPYENNLAMVNFVQLHHEAARFLEHDYADQTIYTAWPLTQALRDPAFGYVDRKMSAFETSDLRVSTLEAIDPKNVNVLVLYSRTWEPGWGVLQWPVVRRFLARYYEYEREMDSGDVRQHFGLTLVRRWTKRGQWIAVYAR
jgi:4-amino-4-deoxy-L-arabinose transferase-like glycosyltransferase